MPSAVRVLPDGTLLAGGEAAGVGDDSSVLVAQDYKRALGDPAPLNVGGRPQSAVALMATALKSVVGTVTALQGLSPERVVLTHPAVWGSFRREQFHAVPRQFDLEAVSFVTEPAAAATHYAAQHGLAEDSTIAVYDLGGGTFDTAVTRVTSAGTQVLGVPQGLEWVGGIDFDEAVVAHVDRAVGGAVSALDPRDPEAAIARQQIRAACVKAKETLSQEEWTTIGVQLPGRHISVPMSRSDFEAIIRTPLESTVAALRRTLASAGLAPEDLAGVLLVGGSSRIPLVAQMLTEDLGRPVTVDPEPQYCVALGAADLSRPRSAASLQVAPRPPIKIPPIAVAPAMATAPPGAGPDGPNTAVIPVVAEANSPFPPGRAPAAELTEPNTTLLPGPDPLPDEVPDSGWAPAPSRESRRPSGKVLAAIVAAVVLLGAGVFTLSTRGGPDDRQNLAVAPPTAGGDENAIADDATGGAKAPTSAPTTASPTATEPGRTATPSPSLTSRPSSTTTPPRSSQDPPVQAPVRPGSPTPTSTSSTTVPAAPSSPKFDLSFCNDILGTTLTLVVNGAAAGSTGASSCGQARVNAGAGFQATVTRTSDGATKASPNFTQEAADMEFRAFGFFSAPQFFSRRQ